MKVLVVGSRGQLGTDLCQTFADTELVPTTRAVFDICNAEQMRAVLDVERPDVVINTAAFHRVDDCEDDVQSPFAVNAFAVRDLARATAERNTVLVHLSTDYVFGGPRRAPWLESDAPCPTNVYGASKVAGEHFVRHYNPRSFVIRTSGLYGTAGAAGKGGNFVETMIRLAKEGRPIRVVDDQVTTPTYTPHLAATIRQLVDTTAFDLYHVTNAGQCSWHEFAGKIFELLDLHPEFSATSTASFAAKAVRPQFSVLKHGALARIGLDNLPPWTEALQSYLRAKGHLRALAPSQT